MSIHPHPPFRRALPDGNKRLAWQALTVFLALNGHDLIADVDEAVAFMLGVAAGEIDEEAAEKWIVAYAA